MFPELDSGPGPHRVPLEGYPRLVEGLLAAVQSGSNAQAYLLHGPPSVGKRSLARLLAQALLCPAEPAGRRPCGHCRDCRLVASGAYADLHWMPEPLRIEQVRELQSVLHLAPVESACRVAVLPRIEQASPGAANCLLKTLEEPPPQAVLILSSDQISEVLPTVLSRCRVLAMRPLPVEAAARALEARWGLEAEQARLLARLAGGRLGWALRAAGEPALLESRAAWLDDLAHTLGSDRLGRMDRAAALVKREEDLAEGLAIWSGWWRDLLLVHHGLEGPVVNRDRLDELRGASVRFGVADALRSLRAIDLALRRLAAKAQAQLALEVLCLELPR